jgi:putative nucleotidyltransferase with HDIG domain
MLKPEKSSKAIATFGIANRLLIYAGIILLASGIIITYYSDPILLRQVAFIILVLSAIALFLSYLLLRSTFKILAKHIFTAINKVLEDDFQGELKVISRREAGNFADSINSMVCSLREKIQQLSTLFEISSQTILGPDLSTILNFILEKALALEKADSGSIMLVDDLDQELVIKAAKDINSHIIKNTRTKIGEGIAGWVAKEGKPLLLINGLQDSRFKGTKNVKDAVSVPIIIKNKVAGVLNLNNKGGLNSSLKFSEDDLKFLTTLANQASTVIHNAKLFEKLRTNYFSIIQALAAAIDAKDPYTRGHSARVAEYAVSIAKQFGLPMPDLETIQAAAYLHDVGKIGIPELILSKAGKLTNEEYEIIKTHPEISAKILAPVHFETDLIPIVRHHHERYNGTGYPDKLSREEIPLKARILAVADSFDAMTSTRPYRPAKSHQAAIRELKRCSGSQFDPKVVDSFLAVFDKVETFSSQPLVTNS